MGTLSQDYGMYARLDLLTSNQSCSQGWAGPGLYLSNWSVGQPALYRLHMASMYTIATFILQDGNESVLFLNASGSQKNSVLHLKICSFAKV